MTVADLQLPIPTEQLLPHRPPMLLVDQLVRYEPGGGSVSANVRHGDLFVDTQGQLADVALVELVAQGYAAIKGYEDTLNQLPVKQGYLVGSRKVTVHRSVKVGEQLMIEISTSGLLEGFSVVDGLIKSGEDVVAEGSIKLWIP